MIPALEFCARSACGMGDLKDVIVFYSMCIFTVVCEMKSLPETVIYFEVLYTRYSPVLRRWRPYVDDCYPVSSGTTIYSNA